MADTSNERMADMVQLYLYPQINNSSLYTPLIVNEQPHTTICDQIENIREHIANITDQDCRNFAMCLYICLFSTMPFVFFVIHMTAISPIIEKCDYAKSCCQNESENITLSDCQIIIAEWCQNGTSNGLADSKQTYCGYPNTFNMIIRCWFYLCVLFL